MHRLWSRGRKLGIGNGWTRDAGYRCAPPSLRQSQSKAFAGGIASDLKPPPSQGTRRARVSGAVYFFTVNLAERRGKDLLVRHVDLLREAFRGTRARHSFSIEAICILPEHLHCLWRLPDGDDDFSTRWRLIKATFSRALPKEERISRSRMRKSERGIWQRRYWEHLIRHERDFAKHVDYVHDNPVKHGHASCAWDWPFTSFRRGAYPRDWVADGEVLDAEWESF